MWNNGTSWDLLREIPVMMRVILCLWWIYLRWRLIRSLLEVLIRRLVITCRLLALRTWLLDQDLAARLLESLILLAVCRGPGILTLTFFIEELVRLLLMCLVRLNSACRHLLKT